MRNFPTPAEMAREATGRWARKWPTIGEFLSSKRGAPGCWEYPGPRTIGGYAWYVDRALGFRLAHRAAYFVTHGTFGRGRFVCHSCDNPPCCNPAHLFLGDARTNNADMARKYRHARGERNARARLTADDVRAIRADSRKLSDIAASYGVLKTTVSEIKRGNIWKHI